MMTHTIDMHQGRIQSCKKGSYTFNEGEGVARSFWEGGVRGRAHKGILKV